MEPGDYTFQCKMIDGKEYLVVTSIEDREEVARVPCAPQALQNKVDMSNFRSAPRPDGSQALTAVQIHGESVEHRIVSN